jgi:hypothetical protein
MVDTFMIMIWVLFGDCSPLYIQLKQVSNLFNERQVQMTARAYSKASCFRIMWAIYEEVRRFFDQGLLADAFRTNNKVQFPEAYVHAFLNDIRVGNSMMRSSYPSELRKIENDKVGGGGGGGNQNNGGGAGRVRGGQGGRGGGGEERGDHLTITTMGEEDITITMGEEGITVIVVEEDITTAIPIIITTTECKHNMGTILTVIIITTTVAMQDGA